MQTSDEQTAKTHNSLFNVLCSVNFLARFSYALARNPVLPLFALALGAGPEGVGLAVGISTVTGIFFKMPAGAISDVVGRRKTMLAGLCFFGLIPFAYLVIDSYYQLVLVRFIHGFATAIYGPVAMAVVAEVAGDRKGELLSWFSSVAIVGTLLGAPIGGFILSLLDGGDNLGSFRVVYMVSALTGAGALALGIYSLRKGDDPVQGKRLRERVSMFFTGIKQVASDRRVVATSAMEGVQNLSMGALEAFLPVYAVTVVGLSAFEAGMLWGVQVIVTLLAKPLMGRISDRWGRRPLIISGMVLCALPMIAIPHLNSFTTLLVAGLVFGLGEAFVTSSSAALVADFCQAKHYGAAMGTFGTIFDVGHASGPILSGLLLGLTNFTVTFTVVGVLLLASLPLFMRIVTAEAEQIS